MIQVRKSINVKYDSNNLDLINEYFATSSHSEIIKQVFSGVLGGNNRAHIAFGPYGAGKSFISTILTGFAVGQYEKKDIDLLIDKFNSIDVEVGGLFRKVSNHHIEYIPVFINGYEGKFDQTLVRNLKKQLSDKGYPIYDVKPTVQAIIESWSKNYKNVYTKFESYLENRELSYDKFLQNINDDDLFGSFSSFYEEVTAGAKIPHLYSDEVISTFEKAAKSLEKQNKGIILVYDEFGRMLQNIENSELNQFMQQLQDLAELANNACKNLSLLFVAHKPISHYFSYLDRERRSEFSKIEKRFSITSIQSDHATFVNIASQFIDTLKTEKIDDQTFQKIAKITSKYKLFSDNFNQTEIDNLIIRGSYPIHPVTMFLLPLISKVFGQNERTLITFLSDTSYDGFLGFTNRNKEGFYYPEQLADYFFLNVDEELDIKEVSILKKNIGLIKSTLPEPFIDVSERIYKFIAVWGTTNANNYVPLNDEFIAFSLGLNKELCEKVLDELSSLKLIRYNRDKRFWYVIESDSIDIDQEILAKRNYLINNQQLVNQTLNKNNPNKYIYPNRHNSSNEVTRFAIIKYQLEGFPPYNLDNQPHDFLVLVRVNSSTLDSSNADMIIDVDFDEKILVALINRLTVIDMLMHDRAYLHTYKNALVDLEFEKARILSELDNLYMMVFASEVLLDNKKQIIKSKEHLSNVLSDYADRVYSETITIRNDQINMFAITTQQLNATLKVIEAILDRESFELDDIFDKSKPEDLIYFSLKTAVQTKQFHKLKDKVIQYLDNNESGKFASLTNIATLPPFGIRPTLSSLLILIIVIDRFKNMLLSRDSNYIATIDAQQIYDAGLGKKDFEYTYSNFDFEHREWMDFVLSTFPEPSEGVLKKSQSIQVLSAILTWFNSLPVIIQQGESIGIQEKYFLRSVENSKTSPFDALSELVKYDIDTIQAVKSSVDEAYELYLERMNHNLLREFQIDNWYDWAMSVDQIKQKTNTLVKIASKTESILRDYAMIIDTIEIERWTKGSYEKLLSMIRSDFLEASGRLDTFSIEINGVKREVQDIMIGAKANNLKRNLVSLIDANLRYVSSSEIEKLIIELVEKYIK